MRKLFATAGATVLAASALMVSAPTSANAEILHYNSVYNSTRSEAVVPVTIEQSTLRRNLSPGSSASNVRAFQIKSGCVGISQWGYEYDPGWWYFKGSNDRLSLLIKCTQIPA